MTTTELHSEVKRIVDELAGLPESERELCFFNEINKLPPVEREIASHIINTTIQIRKYYQGRLVILVHGIRTRAEWQGRLRQLFEADGMTTVEPLGYGFYNVLRFLCPFWTRRKPVDEILFKIRDSLNRHRDKNLEVIFLAHSFGTYILSSIIDSNPDIRPDRMLLCGSVISRTYRWDKLPNRPKHVVNEAGGRDIWPVLAKSATWGYGSTGTFGFQTSGVHDRFHDMCHSDYFVAGFAEKYWVPWVQSGHVEQTSFETSRPTTPFWQNFLEIIQLKWLLLVGIIFGCALLAIRLRSNLQTH